MYFSGTKFLISVFEILIFIEHIFNIYMTMILCNTMIVGIIYTMVFNIKTNYANMLKINLSTPTITPTNMTLIFL